MNFPSDLLYFPDEIQSQIISIPNIIRSFLIYTAYSSPYILTELFCRKNELKWQDNKLQGVR